MSAAQHSFKRTSASPVLLEMLRWCLVLLLIWQAAAPYCHAHVDANLPPHQLSAGERFRLALHLQSCHDSSKQSAPQQHDWHTHFGLPAEALQSSEVSMQEGAAFSALLVPHVPQLSSDGFVLQTSSADDSLAVPGFFGTFAPALSLPARFCVARV